MYRHGASVGYGRTPEYNSWLSMRARVLNPRHRRYPNYGGRGIAICPEWLSSFAAFLNDMGPRPSGQTLDRIDPDGNYEPSNCRWADTSTQNSNRRPFPVHHCRCGYFANHRVPCQTPPEALAA